mmetsp:Transcript_27486/g.57884  ORF Transcript_27486/g.57884 Transcript_27486/m.57884 type:complete len:108 (-) Transcript_27486:124-447(-)
MRGPLQEHQRALSHALQLSESVLCVHAPFSACDDAARMSPPVTGDSPRVPGGFQNSALHKIQRRGGSHPHAQGPASDSKHCILAFVKPGDCISSFHTSVSRTEVRYD